MEQVKELKRRRAKLVADAREISAQAQKEERQQTADERTRFEAFLAEAETLGEDIAQRERLEALGAAVDASGERRGDILPHNESRNLGRYSLLRAIRCMADRGRLDGLEGEVSTELQTRRKATSGRTTPANGFTMPYDLPIDTRSGAVGRKRYAQEFRAGFDTVAGAGGIPTILDTTYIEILRTRMACYAAGARVMTDMIGNFAIPRQSAAATIYWVAEAGSPTASNQTVDQVPFTPRTCGAFTDITRRLAEQINTDAEMFVREDLAAVVARGVDAAALNGTGNNNQPLGILNHPGVTIESLGANGGAPTWQLVVTLETDVAKANADIGALAYMANAVGRGKMKQTTKIASPTYPIFLWESGEYPVNGYPAYVTNQLPSNLTVGTSTGVCSPLIFANWNDLIFAFWTGMDVIVDPYTLSSAGGLRIVTLQDVDINLRHPESFAATIGMTTT